MKIRDAILRLAILGSILLSGICFSQAKSYQFEAIESLQESEKKDVVVFIHTNWCNYCKAMENTTFNNQKVVDLIQQTFYFVILDAEENVILALPEKNSDTNPQEKIPASTNSQIHCRAGK